MKNILSQLSRISSAIALLFMLLNSAGAQQIGIAYQMVSASPTSLSFDVYLGNNSPAQEMRVAAFNYVVNFPTGSISAAPAPVVSFVKNPDFASNTYVAGWTNNASNPLKARVTTTPLGNSGASQLLPTAPGGIMKLGRVTITGTAITVTDPTQLTLSTGGNPQFQAIVYYGAATSSAAITAATGALRLPVEITSFKGRAVGANNLIEWVTASERNAASFVVDRSVNGRDNWEQVGKVSAAGNSDEVREYSLEDKAPVATSYYRLRNIDFDGRDDHSRVIFVERDETEFGVTGAYPSPTADLINVQFESLQEGEATLQMFDFNGRLVLTQQVLADKGLNSTEINMAGLAAGTYTVHILNDTKVSAQMKVVKL